MNANNLDIRVPRRTTQWPDTTARIAVSQVGVLLSITLSMRAQFSSIFDQSHLLFRYESSSFRMTNPAISIARGPSRKLYEFFTHDLFALYAG